MTTDAGVALTGNCPVAFEGADVAQLVSRVREPLCLVTEAGAARIGVVPAGSVHGLQVVGWLPALYPEWLGDRTFGEVHGVRFPYVAGEMAGGIATTGMVIAMADAGMMGFFGAGGLSVDRVSEAVGELSRVLAGRPNWGVNLIHSPAEPATETAVADLLLRAGVPAVSASAFMELTPAVVRIAAHGLRRDAAGVIRRKTRLFAKVSRPEVAARFMTPAPAPMLHELVTAGLLTALEAALATEVPVAEDITAEADSAGHTDNRALTVLLPVISDLRDEIAAHHRYSRPIRIGAAGGLGTPGALAAAFALGGAFVVTGSVNQSCVESGMSAEGRQLLASAGIADVVMAPAADMFELGVRLQVLRTGTMFAFRAAQLYQVYSGHSSWDEVPAAIRAKIEKDMLRAPFAETWEVARDFWAARDPGQAERADRDPKHRMALVFRWYLGLSSRWAVQGDPDRRTDYQIWCGPAMGAFNRWVRGGFLAEPGQRSVVQVARNLLEGAAVITRAQQLRSYGVAVPNSAFTYAPRPLD